MKTIVELNSKEEKINIVKYDNNFNLSDLNSMKAIEQDLFFSICSEFYQSKEMEIKIDLSELKYKVMMTDKKYTEAKYISKLKSMAEKIVKVIFTVEGSDKRIDMMPLFKRLLVDVEKNVADIKLNDEFAKYLFNIPEGIGFTQFRLQNFIILRSKYSKTLFRLLLQNFTGRWEVDWQELKEKIGFPKSYNSGVSLIAINKSIEEIERENYIKNISYEVIKARKPGSPIKKLVFTYEISKERQLELQGQTSIYDHMHEEQMAIDVKAIEQQNTELLGDYEYDEPIVGVAPQSAAAAQPVQQEEERCPKCAGRVEIAKRIKDGVLFKRCENNRHSKLSPNKFCMWTETIK